MCRQFGLSAADLVDKWGAYCINNSVEPSDLKETHVTKIWKDVSSLMRV